MSKTLEVVKILAIKSWLVVGLAVLTGAGVGIGGGFVRAWWYPWDGTPAGVRSGSESTSREIPTGPQPMLVVEETTFDFGPMDTHTQGRHEFVFKNVGEGPLRLTKGPTSCKCTAAILEQGEILPGKSGVVAVEWTGNEALGPFTQTARIMTNDPRQEIVTLTIKGRITVAARAVPQQLVLSGVTAGEETSAQVRVFGFRPEPLEITGHEFSSPTFAESFEVTIKPLPSDQVAEEKDATSGCLVEITVKPGLPLGGFQQKILLQTNYEEAPTVEVPIRGTVGSEISIVGKGWNAKTGILMLGSVRSREGALLKLVIRTAGPHRKEVAFKPIEVFPDLLKVKLGKTTELDSGTVSVTPLTILVPKGSPPADHLQMEQEKLGRIILETNHPTAHQLRILVRFAVEG